MLLAETDGGIEMSKKLIAFYSRADDNYVNGLKPWKSAIRRLQRV